MSELRFTKEHEWIRIENGIGTLGITDYAQGQLGDVVYVELPALGKRIAKGAEAAVVESVKAASEIYAPLAGEVVAINDALAGAPGLVNRSPAGDGWFLKLKLAGPADLGELMDEAAYRTYIAGLS